MIAPDRVIARQAQDGVDAEHCAAQQIALDAQAVAVVVVNWMTGSIPACFSMILTARLETCTMADWLSVTL